jgi:antitoxin CptB
MSVEDHRLKWKCRRGLLELDLILERYFMKHPGERGMDELLDLPDNDLLDIAMGRSDAFGEHLAPVVARLRAA